MATTEELNDTPTATIRHLRKIQGAYFRSGATREIRFRKQMLRTFLAGIKKEEQALLEALQRDLHKSGFEAYSNEIGIVYKEIRHALRHVSRWARVRKLVPDLHLLPGTGRIIPEPYGTALILAPWNYPMQLLFAPLTAAIAAGNNAVVKPSELAPHTARVCERIISSSFPPEYIACAQGGPAVSTSLIEQGFDYIFFTGSVAVGRKIMAAAAPHLTPVTLELGGKSPAIVDATADLDLAARKIAWGKYNNAGQTCVAPDYLLVEDGCAEALIDKIRAQIRTFYGQDPAASDVYGRIINQRHFDRLQGLLDSSPVVHGGRSEPAERYIEPTVMYPVSWQDSIMQDEIFGPILPVLTYSRLDEAIDQVRSQARPLALYVFSRNAAAIHRLTREIPFGGGGVNCTILHVASTKLPFGGIGSSGMGSYHGKAGFDTFSHHKSILSQPARFELPMAYPHKHISMQLLRRILH